MKRILWAAALAAAVSVGVAGPASASAWRLVVAEAGTGNKDVKVRFASVSIDGKEVMRVAETPDLHADERADEVQKRLRMTVAPNPGQKYKPVQASEVTVETVENQLVIRLRNQNVIQVTPQDAKLAGMTQQDLAQKWAEDLRGALKDLKLADGKPKQDFVTVAKGEMTMPKQQAGTKSKGGGAGKGEPPKDEMSQ